MTTLLALSSGKNRSDMKTLSGSKWNQVLFVLALGGCPGFGVPVPTPGLGIPNIPHPTYSETVTTSTSSVATGQVVGGTGGQATGGPSCTGDTHCMNADDLLVCDPYDYCHVGHVLTPPSPSSKNQAEFLMVASGERTWTDHWFKSRPLGKGDQLQLTQPILYYGDGDSGPANHADAIKDRWRWCKVTDLSDLFKSVVHCSNYYGAQDAKLSSVRVILTGN